MSAAERREELIAAAVHEFAHGGLHGTPVERIARRVGVAQPYVFSLFHSKRGIALDNQAIEIFFEQRLDSFRQVSHDLSFQDLNLAENSEGTVLVDRVCI